MGTAPATGIESRDCPAAVRINVLMAKNSSLEWRTVSAAITAIELTMSGILRRLPTAGVSTTIHVEYFSGYLTSDIVNLRKS